MQIFIATLQRTSFPWHTSDIVLLARHGVDSFHIFNTTIKDQNLF